MEVNSEIDKIIYNTLESGKSIKEVYVSPFFKEKVMHQIRNASEDIQAATWSWFTPRLQLATLICVVVLNGFTVSSLQKIAYDENVSNFAESYGLSTSTETSLLN